MALPARLLPADRDRAAAERDSLPLISSSPVFNTAACHSVSTSRVAEQIKSHLRAWTGTIRRCVKLPDSKLNYFRRKFSEEFRESTAQNNLKRKIPVNLKLGIKLSFHKSHVNQE
ncbi:hypothetical protein EYF80_004587 [Liparis tanakae]|uniref:Uncharacterized protein n=1 Tax=Liparis tanakae TaxID=230148 RepID=A0A4Z2J5E7_9TELE|nr:hypothetical protein EYF80_004587 [Liparis tanakae]